LLLVPTVAGSARVQTADEVVEKHIAALGGRAAIGKLTSRRATGTVTIATPAGDLSGPIEITAKVPNKTRAVMELDLTALGAADKMVVEQKFDGTAGWTLNSLQGDTPITGNQLENMKNGRFPTSLVDYKAAGIKVELLPRETIDGKSLIVLLAAPKTGSAVRMYLDPETYLGVRTVTTISTPTGDVEQVSAFSDYRTVDGVKVAFNVQNSNSQQTMTIKLDKVEHNMPLDDALFSVKAPGPI